MLAEKENFLVCLEYLQTEALRAGLPLVGGIIRNVSAQIRRLGDKHDAPLDNLNVGALQDDFVYAFHIFLTYMQSDSKEQRTSLLSTLLSMEKLTENVELTN